MMDQNLEKIVAEHLSDLTDIESSLVRAVAEGVPFDTRESGYSRGAPIRAELLRLLIIDQKALLLIDPYGIHIEAATVTGDLDLSFIAIKFPLRFYECVFENRLNLFYADLAFLELSGTKTPGIDGMGLKVRGDVNLNDHFVSDGVVSFAGANLGGDLDCEGSTFRKSKEDQERIALIGDGLKIDGNVFLRNGFRAYGEVRFLGASIGLNLDCEGGFFLNDHGTALSADGSNIRGDVFLNGTFKAKGRVRLPGVDIRGDVYCDGGTFESSGRRPALSMEVAKVRGSLSLGYDSQFRGTAKLSGVQIGGDLDCTDGRFSSNSETKSNIDPAIDIDDATIGGNVHFASSSEDPHRQNFVALGEIDLSGANVAASMFLTNGLFEGDAAIRADGLRVGDRVLVQKCTFTGNEVRFVGTRIGGELSITKSDLKSLALHLDGSSAARFRTDWSSCPEKGNLRINGFNYNRLSLNSESQASSAVEWVRLQLSTDRSAASKQFSPDPYRQLAVVLREGGDDAQAHEVLIALEDDRRVYGSLTLMARLWARILRTTIGYGYAPARSLLFIGFFVAIGYLIFGSAFRAGYLTPSDNSSKKSEQFCALVYSVDTFVPIVNLGQRDSFRLSLDGAQPVPNAVRPDVSPSVIASALCDAAILPKLRSCWVGYARLFRWVDIVTGWFFATLLVAVVGGLVRRE